MSNLSTSMLLNPNQFYELVDLMKFSRDSLMLPIQMVSEKLKEEHIAFEERIEILAQENKSLLKDAERNTKRNPFRELEGDDSDSLKSLRSGLQDNNFVKVIYDVLDAIATGYRAMRQHVESIEVMPVIYATGQGKTMLTSYEDFQRYSMEVQMNSVPIQNFTNAIFSMEALPKRVAELGSSVGEYLAGYSQRLRHRHTVEGIKIFRDPIITDLAISIHKNVDSDGEIQDGKSKDEISAYSMKKALIITESIKNGWIGEFVAKPDTFISFIKDRMDLLWTTARELARSFGPIADKLRAIVGKNQFRRPNPPDISFRQALEAISDLDPILITYREKTGLLSASERRELDYENETIAKVVDQLNNPDVETVDIVGYILDRKQELRKYHIEQNSFYVCKIDGGNPFGGESPGTLKVVPGIKPTVNLNDVVGSGFDEAREFIEQIDNSNQWSDLFLATSPSKKTDKTNVLLIGPQGCGKTEVLRGVASKAGAIGVFAQASDFLTCWKGEMEKNPKRLFEAGLKLHKEGNRNVFFLIDEIDTILNTNSSQYAFGGTNLSSEFQILMDGIMSYAGLAVWGATNHPDRLPMPILRRFAKVLIVGELSLEHRVTLLKRFCGYMPISVDFPEKAWEDAATKLEGAVGDVVRKVVDHVWREKMSWFISNHRERALEVVKILNMDGVKFDLAKFTADDRWGLLALLRPFVHVTPDDLMRSVDLHLKNLAIKREIQTCVDTYNQAREFIASL